MDGKVIKAFARQQSGGVALIRAGSERDEPGVRLKLHQKEGCVEAVEIQCSCGRTTLIECIYDNSEETSS